MHMMLGYLCTRICEVTKQHYQ